MKPQHFIILLLAVSGYFLYTVFRPFMQDIVIAVLLMFATLGISRPLWHYFQKRWQVSALMTLLLGVIFFAPLVYTINAFARLVAHIDPVTVNDLVIQLSDYVQSVELPRELLEKLGIQADTLTEAITDTFSQESIARYVKHILAFTGTLATHSAAFFKDMLLILVFYFFAYLYGEDLGRALKRLLPLDSAQTHILFNELHNSMGVVFFSILATAIFEGSLFAIIVAFFGLDPILLGILYGFASLVPVVGGALMWIPTAIYLWSTQGSTAALTVALYSVIVISIIADTFIKPMIIKEIDIRLVKETQAVNELLVFFAIIAGLTTYGFWGMILGPAIVTIFMAILKLYEQFQSHQIPE